MVCLTYVTWLGMGIPYTWLKLSITKVDFNLAMHRVSSALPFSSSLGKLAVKSAMFIYIFVSHIGSIAKGTKNEREAYDVVSGRLFSLGSSIFYFVSFSYENFPLLFLAFASPSSVNIPTRIPHLEQQLFGGNLALRIAILHVSLRFHAKQPCRRRSDELSSKIEAEISSIRA